jgi:hypothetical protein
MTAPLATPRAPQAKVSQRKGCAICGKPRDPRYDPFCSKRCADVDLHHWLSGGRLCRAGRRDRDRRAGRRRGLKRRHSAGRRFLSAASWRRLALEKLSAAVMYTSNANEAQAATSASEMTKA